MIDHLNAVYNIPGFVEVSRGKGDLPKVTLVHKSGSRAEVYLHGGHITSWIDAHGTELFFLSKESLFEPKSPIRGGIPVIFPQFGGKGPLPQHGIARTSEWRLAKSWVESTGEPAVEMVLDSSPETLAIWPHEFSLSLTIHLGPDSLSVRMRVVNTGEESFGFQGVLHTYFAVDDIRQTNVNGLQGTQFTDSLQCGAASVEDRSSIPFAGETDRIYVAVPDSVRIDDAAGGRSVSIEKREMPDVVVWNPWIDKSRGMKDFGDEEYLRMVCVETGVIAGPIELQPDDEWVGETRFSCSSLHQ